MTRVPRGILALDQGLGKTRCAIEACLDRPGKSLIICPASVKMVWADEVKKWGDGAFSQVVTTKTQTLEDVDFYIINYDIVKKILYKFPHFSHISKLVIDESQYVKNWKAQRTKAVLELVGEIPTVWFLSGTPIPSKPMDIWASGNALGLFSMSYRKFGTRYCNGHSTHFCPFDVTGSSNLEELQKILEPKMLRYTKEQVMKDLPEKRYQVISLDLPISKAEKALDREALRGATRPGGIEGLAELMKDMGMQKVGMAVDHVVSLMQDNEKLLVFAHHKCVIETLQKHLGKEYEVSILTGSCTMKNRQEAVNKFQNDGCQILIASVEAAKVGLTLTAASTVVFVEASWSQETIFQAVDRVHRIGQNKPVLAQFLTINKSVDEYQISKALGKRDIVSKLVVETERNEMTKKELSELGEIKAMVEGVVEEVRLIRQLIGDSEVLIPAEDVFAPPISKATPKTVEADVFAPPISKATPKTVEADVFVPPSPLPSEQDARAAIGGLWQKSGVDAARELLREFGAQKISEVAEDRRLEFISRCT